MFNGKRHILILCSRLDLPGGIERAITNTASLFASKGNKVSILILDETDKLFFRINSSISIYTEQLSFGITGKGNKISRKVSLFNQLRVLKKKINGLAPDIIITTEYHFTIAAALVIKNLPIFSWEHHHFHWLKRNRFWNFLHKKMYPKINAVVTLNKTEERLFMDYGCKTVVIPNFVEQQAKVQLNNHLLLSIGWLNWRKGVTLIPLIAEKVFEKHPDWKWNIIGSGEKKAELEKYLVEKCLSEKIKIIEPVSGDISEEYKQASIYVMTSRFECFPMVLLEAMSLGVPCISFDCPTGPSDIIQNGIDGRLVEKENVSAMANAIIELIENEEKRKKMGANAFENVRRFSPDHIYKLWENLFDLHSDYRTDK